jgi:hypothetical protein
VASRQCVGKRQENIAGKRQEETGGTDVAFFEVRLPFHGVDAQDRANLLQIITCEYFFSVVSFVCL